MQNFAISSYSPNPLTPITVNTHKQHPTTKCKKAYYISICNKSCQPRELLSGKKAANALNVDLCLPFSFYEVELLTQPKGQLIVPYTEFFSDKVFLI